MSWTITKENAIDKLEGAKLLLANRLYTDAYEAGFFAIEIALKAWMLKDNPKLANSRQGTDGPTPWFSHDIDWILRSYPRLDNALRYGCPRVHNLLRQCSADATIWKPWKRYRYRAEESVARTYVNIAEGLQKWMLSTLLKL